MAFFKEFWRTEVPKVLQNVRSAYGVTLSDPVSHVFSEENIGDLHKDGELVMNHSRRRIHQEKVPKLPVPSLKHTVELLLRSLEALATPEEYERVQRKAGVFLKPGGEGEKLQCILEERHHASETSWLEPWSDTTFLATRHSIPIGVNYFFALTDRKNHTPSTKRTESSPGSNTNGPHPFTAQVDRASSLLFAAASVCHEMRQSLPPWNNESLPDGSPLCLSQYRRFFCASRIPGPERDTIVSYSTVPLTNDEVHSQTCAYDDSVDPSHAIIIYKDRFYRIELFEKERPRTLKDIVSEVADALLEADACVSLGKPVGLVTTLPRDESWSLTQKLLREGNEDTLHVIRSAVLVMALESFSPVHPEEVARLLFHGPGGNRWFDRHCWVVFRDGNAGVNFEHSVGDGAQAMVVVDDIHKRDAETIQSSEDISEMLYKKAGLHRETVELQWKLTPDILNSLTSAGRLYRRFAKDVEAAVSYFEHFGGRYLKTKAGVSPDAFMQCAIQLTHYRLCGYHVPTYESATTRKFLHGRTEGVRSASRATADFCEAIDRPILGHQHVNSKVPSQAELLHEACRSHVSFMQESKEGRGVDRHLFALRSVCIEQEFSMPKLLNDPLVCHSGYWLLSTSHCGCDALCQFGFGPVVPEGLGIGYMIKQDSICTVITSMREHCREKSNTFARMLESTLLQMKVIIDSDWERRRGDPPVRHEFLHPTLALDGTFGYWSTPSTPAPNLDA